MSKKRVRSSTTKSKRKEEAKALKVKRLDKYTLICGNSFNEMRKMENGSVDMIFTDPPYGITQNPWDKIPPLEEMWEQFNRITKDNGAMVITAAQPFASQLLLSNADNFKYEVIWKKTVGSGQLNIKRQPLRVHENILIFYRKQPVYNEQKTKGKPYKIERRANYSNENYGQQVDSSKINNGFRHAQSVIEVSNPRIKGGHPTQKPVPLIEYFVKTFTEETQVVFDPFMGSGSTGEACVNLNRKFVGIELDAKYFTSSKERLEKCLLLKK